MAVTIEIDAARTRYESTFELSGGWPAVKGMSLGIKRRAEVLAARA